MCLTNCPEKPKGIRLEHENKTIAEIKTKKIFNTVFFKEGHIKYAPPANLVIVNIITKNIAKRHLHINIVSWQPTNSGNINLNPSP